MRSAKGFVHLEHSVFTIAVAFALTVNALPS